MPGAIPKLKANEVVERAITLLSGLSHYLPRDDKTVAELLADAKASIPVAPALGHSAMAVVYQLVGDEANARHHIDNAIKLAASEPVLYRNKASILVNFGYVSESQKIYGRAADPERGMMSNAWSIGYPCAAFQTMQRHVERARIMNLDISGLDVATAEKAARILDQEGLTEADLGKVLDIAGKVLRQHKLFFLGEVPEITVFEGPEFQPFIRMVYELGISAEDADSLYHEFVDRLAERMSELPVVLSVSFRAKET